jgi:hypothetical protein
MCKMLLQLALLEFAAIKCGVGGVGRGSIVGAATAESCSHGRHVVMDNRIDPGVH